jgi:hypothetical protein
MQADRKGGQEFTSDTHTAESLRLPPYERIPSNTWRIFFKSAHAVKGLAKQA